VKTNPASPGSPAVVQEFRYNGLGHRIGWHYDTTRNGGGAPDGTTDSYDPWYYFQYTVPAGAKRTRAGSE
jgi:hypothetical protein